MVLISRHSNILRGFPRAVSGLNQVFVEMNVKSRHIVPGAVIWPCLTGHCFIQGIPHCAFPPWTELSNDFGNFSFLIKLWLFHPKPMLLRTVSASLNSGQFYSVPLFHVNQLWTSPQPCCSVWQLAGHTDVLNSKYCHEQFITFRYRQLGNPGQNNSSNQSGLSLAHGQWFTWCTLLYIIPGIYIFIFIYGTVCYIDYMHIYVRKQSYIPFVCLPGAFFHFSL